MRKGTIEGIVKEMNMGNNSNRSVLVSKEFGIKIKDELALFDTRV